MTYDLRIVYQYESFVHVHMCVLKIEPKYNFLFVKNKKNLNFNGIFTKPNKFISIYQYY